MVNEHLNCLSMHAFPIIIHILTKKKSVIISLRGVFTDLASPFLLLEITTVVANSRDDDQQEMSNFRG